MILLSNPLAKKYLKARLKAVSRRILDESEKDGFDSSPYTF